MEKKYFELKSMISNKDIKDIIAVCKSIGTYQRTVQYSVYCYMSHIHKKTKNHDSIYLVSSSILLGCKISNFIPKMDLLLENIFIHFKLNLEGNEVEEFREEIIKLELQMSIALDFKFDIEDQYLRVRDFGEKLKAANDRKHDTANIENSPEATRRLIQCLWIFMNDSLFYPFRLFFDLEIIFSACLYLSYKINNQTKELKEIIGGKNEHEVLFVAEELLNGYEKNMKK